ncbi:MAG: TolC family protein [Bacteroidetes bacterium]|nr:TolC family protein [Bacteroidota bacterium]
MKRYIKPLIGGMLMTGIVLGFSCRIPSSLVKKQPLNLPETYSGIPDTLNIGADPRIVFFKDATLIGLIDIALAHNADLQNTIQKVMIARASLLTQKGLGLPTLDFFASAGFDKYGKYTMSGVGNFDTNLSQNIDKNQKVTNPAQDFFLGLKSNWEIDLWGKIKSRKKAAYARVLASEKGRQWVTTQLVAAVASYYYELLALDNRLEIVHRNIALQERAVEVVKAQKEAGRATSLAVQQFSAQLLQTQSLEYETSLNILRLENELNTLLGRYAQTPVPRGITIRQQQLISQIHAGIPLSLLTQRPDIQQAEWELAASKADVDAARKAFLPALNITPYVGFNAFKLPLLLANGSLAYGLLGGLTQPLMNRYQLKGDFAIADAQQQIAVNNYKQTILQAYEEVISDLRGIEHYKKIVALNQSEVETLTEAVATSNDLYFSGYASYLEVITAQKGVLEAELKRTIAQKELLLNTVNLYRSLGGGWE